MGEVRIEITGRYVICLVNISTVTD